MPYPVATTPPKGYTKRPGASAIDSNYDVWATGSRFNKSNPYKAVLVKRGK